MENKKIPGENLTEGREKFENLKEIEKFGLVFRDPDFENVQVDNSSLIRELKKRKLTVKDISDVLNGNRITISKFLETPESMPVGMALKLSELLGVKIDELFALKSEDFYVHYPFKGVPMYINKKTLELYEASEVRKASLRYYEYSTGREMTEEEYETLKKKECGTKIGILIQDYGKYAEYKQKVNDFNTRYGSLYVYLGLKIKNTIWK